MDFYNALNSGIVTSVNDTFGQSWLTPEAIQSGRFVRFGVQVNF